LEDNTINFWILQMYLTMKWLNPCVTSIFSRKYQILITGGISILPIFQNTINIWSKLIELYSHKNKQRLRVCSQWQSSSSKTLYLAPWSHSKGTPKCYDKLFLSLLDLKKLKKHYFSLQASHLRWSRTHPTNPDLS
jgi:hypothetical protein